MDRNKAFNVVFITFIIVIVLAIFMVKINTTVPWPGESPWPLP